MMTVKEFLKKLKKTRPFMDDVIQAKIATIEKCLKRSQEEASHDWKTNYTPQDALLLNLERAL